MLAPEAVASPDVQGMPAGSVAVQDNLRNSKGDGRLCYDIGMCSYAKHGSMKDVGAVLDS